MSQRVKGHSLITQGVIMLYPHKTAVPVIGHSKSLAEKGHKYTQMAKVVTNPVLAMISSARNMALFDF